MRQYFTQNPAPDNFVRLARALPPPAVPLHGLGRHNKAIDNRFKIRATVIQAKDQPTCSHPTQRQTLRAKIVLKHPVVTTSLSVIHRPDAGQISYPHRQMSRFQSLVEVLRPAIPGLIQIVIKTAYFRLLQLLQKKPASHPSHKDAN